MSSQRGAFLRRESVLKAMRDEFRNKGLYVENAEEVDIVMFNSFPLGQIDLLRRTVQTLIDNSDIVAQSRWSFTFDPWRKPQSKLSIVIMSWFSNWRKEFEDYKWLDENLEFNKYLATFVGNSPIIFENIQMLEPLANEELSLKLRKHKVFLAGSRVDPCSDSLIETLHTGLPVIFYNGGGHQELVGEARLAYDCVSQIPCYLEELGGDYDSYKSKIRVSQISQVA